MTSLPGIIHLGFAKCGSTFLRSCLRRHPDVNLVFKSNFFGPFESCHFERADAEYQSFFKNAQHCQFQIESDEHLLMPHIHPELGVRGITTQSTSVISERISRVVPNVKLVLVIRNQLDMMLSTYSQYLLGGGTLGLEDFTNRMVHCQADQENYFSFFYDQILAELQDRFPNQVQVVLFEDLARNSDHVLLELGSFLGIQPLVSTASFKDKRVGLSMIGMVMIRSFNRTIVFGTRRGAYQPKMVLPDFVYKFLCNGVRVWEHYAVRQGQFDKRRMASSIMQQRFRELFGESNARLAKLLNRDLAEHGYSLIGTEKLSDTLPSSSQYQRVN